MTERAVSVLSWPVTCVRAACVTLHVVAVSHLGMSGLGWSHISCSVIIEVKARSSVCVLWWREQNSSNSILHLFELDLCSWRPARIACGAELACMHPSIPGPAYSILTNMTQLEAFLNRWRAELAPTHSFVFSARNGAPLTMQGVHRIFTSSCYRLARPEIPVTRPSVASAKIVTCRGFIKSALR